MALSSGHWGGWKDKTYRIKLHSVTASCQGIYSRWPTEGTVYLEEQGAVPAQRLSEDTNSALLATEAEVASSNMELKANEESQHPHARGREGSGIFLA